MEYLDSDDPVRAEIAPLLDQLHTDWHARVATGGKWVETRIQIPDPLPALKVMDQRYPCGCIVFWVPYPASNTARINLVKP